MFKICFQIIFSNCAPTHFSILLPHPSQLSSCLALVNPTQWLKPGMFPMCPTICSTPPQWPWPQYPLQPPQVLLLPRENPLSPAIMTNPGALEQQVAVQPIGCPLASNLHFHQQAQHRLDQNHENFQNKPMHHTLERTHPGRRSRSRTDLLDWTFSTNTRGSKSKLPFT